jgi:hypothetical protein
VQNYLRRHEAWDRDCRARGMTAREQADELQIRCAWVRLRRKASAATLRRPPRYLEILERAAREETGTLMAVGGNELASIFWQTFHATNPLDVLTSEAAAAVRACARGHPASHVRMIALSATKEATKEKDGSARSRKASTRVIA